MLDTNPRLGSSAPLLASTHGWDTVFGITFADVNSAIVKAGTTPAGFDYDNPGVELIFGTYDRWRLTGGEGHLLRMTLDVPELTLQFSGQAAVVRREVQIEIEVELGEIPQPQSESKPGRRVEFRLKGLGPSNAAVAVVSVTYPQLDPAAGFPGQPASSADGLIPEFIGSVFEKSINRDGELQKFNHAFFAVNLNMRPLNAAFAWLAPTSVSYGISSKNGAGILAVLCMTEGRPKPSNQDVSPELIPGDARAGFLIAKERFLTNLLLPGLGLMFDDPGLPGKTWPQSYFKLAGNGTRITNTVPLSVRNFQINGATEPASIDAEGFEADLSDTWMTLRYTRFKHAYHLWYDVYHDVTLDTHMALNKDGKHLDLLLGSGEIGPDGNDMGQLSHFATIEKNETGKAFDWAVLALDITLLLVGIGQYFKAARVAAEAGAATDAALKGAAQVTIRASEAAAEGSVALVRNGATLLHGTVSGLTQAETAATKWLSAAFYGISAGIAAMNVTVLLDQLYQIIENAGDNPENAIPDLNLFVTMAMEPIEWPDQAGFNLTSVALNGGLSLGGDPTFAHD